LEAQRGRRAKRIVALLAGRLEREFGRGFAEKNRPRMIQLADVVPDQRIVESLIRQLTWTHFIALIPIEEALAREFYAALRRSERRSVRALRSRMLFERTALSRKPARALEMPGTEPMTRLAGGPDRTRMGFV
jgi:hypothetical protein